MERQKLGNFVKLISARLQKNSIKMMTRNGKRQRKIETEPNRGNLLLKKTGVFLSMNKLKRRFIL